MTRRRPTPADRFLAASAALYRLHGWTVDVLPWTDAFPARDALIGELEVLRPAALN